MTKKEATDILCYIAQDFLEPFALDDSVSEELRHKMLGEQFSKLYRFINGKVEENESKSKVSK